MLGDMVEIKLIYQGRGTDHYVSSSEISDHLTSCVLWCFDFSFSFEQVDNTEEANSTLLHENENMKNKLSK